MKTKMKMRDWREMGADRLKGRVQKLVGELRLLRESVYFGKEKNHAQIRQLKRDVARVKTALRELK